MKTYNVKIKQLLALALIIILFLGLCIFLYFYKYNRYVTIYYGNKEEHIEKIVEILESNNVFYEIENYTEPSLDEVAGTTKISIRRIDYKIISELINNEY